MLKSTTWGPPMQMLDCSTKEMGIGGCTLHLPDRYVTAAEYFSQPRSQFSLEQIRRDWPDTLIEAEYVFRFFSAQMSPHLPVPSALETFASESGCKVVYVSEQSSSDLAVEAARKLSASHAEEVRKAQAIIFYSSTLNTQPVCSTPCRLQHELRLKSADAFGVAQKGANVEFTALKLAAEAILAEDSRAVILVGAERFVSPYQRFVAGLALFGDSASAMVVSQENYAFRLLYLSFTDHCLSLAAASGGDVAAMYDLIADKAVLALGEILNAAGLTAESIRVVLPPNWALPVLRRISARSTIPWHKLCLSSLTRAGCLASSDLVASLSDAIEVESLQPGDLMIAFGISLECSVACALLRYTPKGAVYE
jgi:3-oxoacyl-[acyl-carrier-protein] synthase III